MPTLMPTGHCFDDGIHFLEARVRHDPREAWAKRLILVHGIVLFIDGPRAGERYAHAWVEEAGACWDAALCDGERVYYQMPAVRFYELRRVQQTTRYTIRQVWQQNRRHCTYGPWRPEYLALCGEGGTVAGSYQLSAADVTTIVKVET